MLRVLVLLAYGFQHNEQNIYSYINFIDSLEIPDITVDVVICWNKLNNIEIPIKFKDNYNFINKIENICIEEPYKYSTKAYHSWGNAIKSVNIDTYSKFLFLKDTDLFDIKSNISCIFNNLHRKIIFSDVILTYDINFAKWKIAYINNNRAIFPRTNCFCINLKILKYLLSFDFFLSKQFQLKHRQYDLIKVLTRFDIFIINLHISKKWKCITEHDTTRHHLLINFYNSQ
jgi:hypothetical protein